MGTSSLGFEEYSREELEAAASFGIGDKFAIRIAGRDVGGSDAPYRSVTGGYDYGAEDRDAGRVTLRISPSDTFDITLRVQGGSDDSELEPLRPVGVYANLGTLPTRPTVSLALMGGLTRRDPEPAVRVDHERGRRRSSDLRHRRPA